MPEPMTPDPRRKVRVDLGCGRAKLPGFIGIDRFPMPGVDVVADLDAPLPMADDSVDLVHASHSLEHVRDLSRTIREIYRVCKHGAQVCIVAPYYQQGLNVANPYHKHAFNEHTPRFWTASAATPIDPAEYDHPHAPSWGLLESDHSTPDIDIRCVKMEFFYFPGYRDLPADLRRRRRRHDYDICDQVVYHLLVLKRPVSDEAFFTMSNETEFLESPYVTIRRLRERCEQLAEFHREAFDYSRKLEANYREAFDYSRKLEADCREVSAQRDKLEANCREADRRNKDLSGAVGRLEASLARLHRDLEEAARENSALKEAVSRLEGSHREQRDLIATITGGTGWRALQSLNRVRAALAPPSTLRGRLAGLLWVLPRRILRRGIPTSDH